MSRDTEQALLGAILVEGDGLARAAAILDPEDFESRGHGEIFAAMLRVSSRAERVDSYALLSELGDRVEVVGGRDYILSLPGLWVHAGNIGFHAAQVREASITRRAQRIAREGRAAGLTGSALVDFMRRRLEEIGGAQGSEGHASTAASFIDWSTFWERDNCKPEWLFDDVLARGRGHAIYAIHKGMKSLLLLFICARLATGGEPVVVLYLDYEMSQDDLFDRLEDMGYGPSTDLSRLRYALLPSLPPLDTAAGSRALMELVDQVQGEWPAHHLLLVIDTISRAVSGEENSSDAFRDFYAHTGIELKRRRVTWVRLDHGGKDPTRGQRGSSSKGDDVDLVWKLARTENGVCLQRDVARMVWVPERVTFGLTGQPLTFRPLADDWPAGTNDTADALDRLNVPLDASTRTAGAALKAADQGKRRQVVVAALKWRRERLERGE